MVNRCWNYVAQRQTLRDRSITHVNYILNQLMHIPGV